MVQLDYTDCTKKLRHLIESTIWYYCTVYLSMVIHLIYAASLNVTSQMEANRLKLEVLCQTVSLLFINPTVSSVEYTQCLIVDDLKLKMQFSFNQMCKQVVYYELSKYKMLVFFIRNYQWIINDIMFIIPFHALVGSHLEYAIWSLTAVSQHTVKKIQKRFLYVKQHGYYPFTSLLQVYNQKLK